MAHPFTAILDIIGVNPFVYVPEPILEKLFETAGRRSGPIPIRGSVNGKDYRQTLVRYRGAWRLYVNLTMLQHAPQRIGERLSVTVEQDPEDRSIPMHPALDADLRAAPDTRMVFDSLRPSLQKEIVRYIAGLKSEAAIARNVLRAIDFLNGKGRFVGRDTFHG